MPPNPLRSTYDDTTNDPLVKRELFAIRLRKEKKAQILKAKRDIILNKLAQTRDEINNLTRQTKLATDNITN
jgi:hypothetical protein